MMPSLNRRRRVSVDSNVLMAAIAYRSKVAPLVLERIRARDESVVSNIILFQCTRQSRKRNCKLDEESIRKAVLEICPDVVMIEVLPIEELRKRYSIRDEGDLEVLYSIDARFYPSDTAYPVCTQGAHRSSDVCGVTVGEAKRAHLCGHGAECIRPFSIESVGGVLRWGTTSSDRASPPSSTRACPPRARPNPVYPSRPN